MKSQSLLWQRTRGVLDPHEVTVTVMVESRGELGLHEVTVTVMAESRGELGLHESQSQ